MKSVVILLVVLVLAGGAWWFTGGQDNANTSAVDEAATTESENKPDASETVLVEEVDEPTDSNDAVTEADSGGDQESVATETAVDETTAAASPFAVVESEEGQGNEQLEEVAQQPQLPAAEQEIEGAQRSLEPIEVPSSYPVTDAAKYFIPKEERGPGNLGGPPPLDFPGGPSDPNRDTNQGAAFQPPPVPGQ